MTVAVPAAGGVGVLRAEEDAASVPEFVAARRRKRDDQFGDTIRDAARRRWQTCGTGEYRPAETAPDHWRPH